MNNIKRIILCAVIFLAGLLIMLYPVISSYIHQRNQVGVIQDYREKVEQMTQEQIDEMKRAAMEYNARIAEVSINQDAESSAARHHLHGHPIQSLGGPVCAGIFHAGSHSRLRLGLPSV